MDSKNITLISSKSKSLLVLLLELWQCKDLLFRFALRDIKIRYKQTLLGVVWVILQPMLGAGIFTVIFGQVIDSASVGMPYFIFIFSGMLVWQMFSRILTEGSTSLSANQALITKVYFPRLILPLISTVTASIDFYIGFAVLLIMLACTDITLLKWTSVFVPLFSFFVILCAVSFSIWLSALDALYRDIRHMMGLIVQLWLFSTPIVYPLSIINPKWQALYYLNPMACIVLLFRWILFGGEAPALSMIITALLITTVLLLTGILFFRKTETTMVDTI